MGVFAGPEITESGLVLALDAANNKSILSAVEVLVVAGGGGGGSFNGGGGGAGGLIYSSIHTITPGSAITATVGNGGVGDGRPGNGASGASGAVGTNGGPSVFGSLEAIGGGVGASYSVRTSGVSGGSGGGSWGSLNFAGGTAGQGNAGGGGYPIGNNYTETAGGGGGAGSNGVNGGTSSNQPGAGGLGLLFSISGNAQFYAAGGAAGANRFGGSALGGSGIGGNGGTTASVAGVAGVPNTGSGGGGAAYNGTPGSSADGGAGGSGIVIVRYPGSQRATGGTITSVGGYTIHTFTTSGTFTPTWGDMSTNGNTGTLNGVGYSASNGGSLSFDGSNDYVDCVLNSGLTGTGSWTMSAWFKINGAPSAGLYQNAIVDTDATGGSANMICTDWSGYHGGSQNQLLYTSRPSTGGSYTNLLGPVLTQGIWYNATVVRNGTTDTKLYTNGSLSATYTGNIPTATQPLVRIGRWTDGTNYANCNISQVQIYNRALTAAEIQQNFNATRSRFGI